MSKITAHKTTYRENEMQMKTKVQPQSRVYQTLWRIASIVLLLIFNYVITAWVRLFGDKSNSLFYRERIEADAQMCESAKETEEDPHEHMDITCEKVW